MVSRRHAAARERTSDAHKCLQLRAALLQRCSNHFDGHVAVLFSVEPSVRWEKKKGGEAISGGDLRFVSGHAGAFSRSQLSGCGVTTGESCHCPRPLPERRLPFSPAPSQGSVQENGACVNFFQELCAWVVLLVFALKSHPKQKTLVVGR